MPNDVLLEAINPFGNIQALVEVEGGACYFYLVGEASTEFGTRSVWIRNLEAAPESLDVVGMRDGRAPLNPRAHTREPRGAKPPRPSDLRVVWLPEGNGAAVYERDTMLAIIPPWSGSSGFQGYAAGAVGEGPVAWELPAKGEIIDRFREAERYWAAWDTDAIWPHAHDAVITSLESALGVHSNYYAIDGGEWPPKALLRIPRADGTVLVTTGVSLVPQPNVELTTEDWRAYRRIELAALLPMGWPDEAIKRFGGYLSGQSRLPWNLYTWLGPGHTIPCDAWRNPAYTAALLVRDHPALSAIPTATALGDPVTVLWFIPISDSERQFAMDEGSAALQRRLPPDRWRDA